MTEVAIHTNNLIRDFGSVRVIDGLSLEIPVGIVFGLVGPNGAGKTTTIRLLLGLLKPTNGYAKVMGFDTRTQAHLIYSQTGVVLEHPGHYERLSAEENLEFYARSWHLSSTERRMRIKELLTHFNLWERREEAVATWSKGMKKKLAVARSLLHRPSLILLDEPTSGLDPIAAKELCNDLAALANQEGCTVFFNTHNLVEAEELCKTIGVIRRGKLVTVGSIEELQTKNGDIVIEVVGSGLSKKILELLRSRHEVGSPELQNNCLRFNLYPKANTAPIISFLVKAGVKIEEVRKKKASLKEILCTLMEETE